MALVDAYSAMILDRPYRKALSYEEAIAEIRENAGTQFDPDLVEPFLQHHRDRGGDRRLGSQNLLSTRSAHMWTTFPLCAIL